MRAWILVVGMVILGAHGALFAEDLSEETRAERETALVEWLGVVRYFHPSEAVEDADWDGLLRKSLTIAAEAEDNQEFVTEVQALIEPVTIGMSLDEDGNGKGALPEDCDESPLRWVHRGFNAWPSMQGDQVGGPYSSRRTTWPEAGTGIGEDELPVDWEMRLPDERTVRVPLALCPEDAEHATEVEVPETEFGNEYAERARHAIAVQAPVFRYFYPYPHVMEEDWDEWIRTGLVDGAKVETRDDLQVFLEEFFHPLNDGHLRVVDTQAPEAPEFLPIDIAWQDGRAVVIRVEEDAEIPLEPGDRITAVSGEPIEDWHKRQMGRFSGSPQWREWRTRQKLLVDHADESSLSMEYERDGEREEIELAYSLERELQTPEGEEYQEYGHGVIYVDLRAMEMADLTERLDALIEAEVVVFDVRGYPTDAGAEILDHLLEEPDEWGDWMRVLGRPGPEEDLIPIEAHGWNRSPAEDAIEGEVVFLTDGSALSYAESVIGMVKKHDLGTVVGTPTAGTNGNILGIEAPAGFYVIYTGMQVLNPEGFTFQGVGLQPDVTVQADPDKLAAGRDPVLEGALEAVDKDPALIRSD